VFGAGDVRMTPRLIAAFLAGFVACMAAIVWREDRR